MYQLYHSMSLIFHKIIHFKGVIYTVHVSKTFTFYVKYILPLKTMSYQHSVPVEPTTNEQHNGKALRRAHGGGIERHKAICLKQVPDMYNDIRISSIISVCDH